MLLDIGIIASMLIVLMVGLSYIHPALEKHRKKLFAIIGTILAMLGLILTWNMSRSRSDNTLIEEALEIKDDLNKRLEENEKEYQKKVNSPANRTDLSKRAADLLKRLRE